MRRFAAILGVFVLCAVAIAPSTSWSHQHSPLQDLIDGIIQDVIGRTIDAASEEVRRSAGRNHAPKDASDETRHELQKLDEKHERKIAKLESELQRKLTKAQDEFERDAAKEDKAGKIEKKRQKLQEKVDKAYDKFEEKIGEEN